MAENLLQDLGQILSVAGESEKTKIKIVNEHGYAGVVENTDPKAKQYGWFQTKLEVGETFIGFVYVDWPCNTVDADVNIAFVSDTQYGSIYQDFYTYFKTIPDAQSSSTHHTARATQYRPGYMEFLERAASDTYTQKKLGVEIRGISDTGYLTIHLCGIIIKNNEG